MHKVYFDEEIAWQTVFGNVEADICCSPFVGLDLLGLYVLAVDVLKCYVQSNERYDAGNVAITLIGHNADKGCLSRTIDDAVGKDVEPSSGLAAFIIVDARYADIIRTVVLLKHCVCGVVFTTGNGEGTFALFVALEHYLPIISCIEADARPFDWSTCDGIDYCEDVLMSRQT